MDEEIHLKIDPPIRYWLRLRLGVRFIYMALKDALEHVFPTNSEEERKKIQTEKTHKRWLGIERTRQKREIYEIKEFSGWMYVGPILGLLVAVLAGIILWASGGADDMQWLWWIVGTGIAPLMFFGAALDLDEKWKASVIAKEELHKLNPREDDTSRDFTASDRLLNGYRYKHGYLYTDSAILNWFYKLARFIAGFSTVIFGALAAWLLFMWLGTISIAPTTIIIVLLVMLLLKEK